MKFKSMSELMANPPFFKPLKKHQPFLFILMLLMGLTACQKNMEPLEQDFNKILDSESAKAMRAPATVVNDWYNLQTKMMLYANPNPSPLVTGRFFAYEGMALYEAVRHGIPGSVSLTTLLYQMPALPQKENNNGYSWPVAANAALAYMTRHLFAGLTPANHISIDSLENVNNNNLSPGIESEVFRRSQQFGQAIASAVFEWSKTDGSLQANPPYSPPVFPGAWVPTPPANLAAAAPYLGTQRPLLATHLTGVAPALPYTYSEVPGSPYYNEISFTYSTCKNATDEQKTIARFWADVGVGTGYSTPGHHMKILTKMLEDRNADLGTAAMAYAKTGIALRDALILTWRSKYYHSLIRPVTYVRNVIDPNWMPLLGTPNHPEYPAGHASITAAFMETMAGIFGDNVSFTDNSYSFLGFAPRNYANFSEAATEAGWSRIYAGIHNKTSVEQSLLFGKQIGTTVRNLQLQQ